MTTPHRVVVSCRGVTLRFGDTLAVEDLSLDIHQGEFFSLLGPSGCGKTSTLRMLAGFEAPDAGEIRLLGEVANARRPYERPLAMVFQNYALFPHLSVEQNVAFGLEQRRLPGAEIRDRVRRALELVRLDPAVYSGRRPSQLSGGQRQRVALARALVLEPPILLLDEPLGALDLKLRRQMQVELKALNRQLGITFVYVTHDQDEALTMSDRIAVMRQGRVAQVGTPAEIYERPRTRFVAGFIGECNVFRGTTRQGDEGWSLCTRGGLSLRLPDSAAPAVGRELQVGVRPEWIRLRRGEAGQGNENAVPGVVADIAYRGDTRLVRLEPAEGDPIAVVIRSDGADEFGMPWRPGDAALATWDPAVTRILEDD